MPSSTGTASAQRRKPVDLLRAYKLRIQSGLSYRAIAQATGQSSSSLHRALKDLCRLLDDPQRLNLYTDMRAQLYTVAEEQLFHSLSDKHAIEKAGLRDRAVAFGIVVDKRRLEEGKSTNNLSLLGKLIMEAEGRLGAPIAQAEVQATPRLGNLQAGPGAHIKKNKGL